MSGKFNTTSSSLFGNDNKNNVPNWMENLTENLKIKDHNRVELQPENLRGAFAQAQPVYRPEGDASLRALAHNFNDTKLITDAKIELAKFLSGKYYKVKNAYAGSSNVTLEVNLDGVGSQFQFPFEVRANKLGNSNVFFGNEGEYPFSKAGLEECLLDIKNNKTKASKLVEAVNKHYVINREEIVRRFNGSLREATNQINSLLNEGVIVGAGSNSYASFYDLDQLFPQMEKEASEERLPEFHYAPNTEHVEVNPYKPANVLAIEASRIISDNFSDFMIQKSVRDGSELLVKAMVLNKNNVKSVVDFSFDIVDEKVSYIKLAEVNDKRMNLNQLHDYLNSKNNLLNQYLTQNKVASNRMHDSVVFTRKDIKEKLAKVVTANKVDRMIDTWVTRNLVSQINSTTFATKNSFEDLLSRTVVANVLSQDEIEEIESYQKHFGEGLSFERDIKANDDIRDIDELEDSDETKLSKLEHHLSKSFKNFTISNFSKTASGNYSATLNFVSGGVRNSIGVKVDFDSNSNRPEVTANINSKTLSVDNLISAFEKSPVLANYLSDSKGKLIAGKTITTIDSLQRKLANLVDRNDVDKLITSWLSSNLLVNIGDNQYVSNHSFEELLQLSKVAAISETELANRIARQKRDRGMEITSNHIQSNDTRSLDESWSPERMAIHASREISSMFKDFEMLDVELNENSYSIASRIVNPINGLKQNLKFTFAMVNGLPKKLTSVSDDEQEVPATEILNLLETKNEAVKQFAQYNQVNKRSYKNIINTTRLENMLKTIASDESIPTLMHWLLDNNIMEQISDSEFASARSMTEIVAHLSEAAKTNLKAAREQMSNSLRDEHKLDLRGYHIEDTDNRTLEAKVLELSPDMVKLQNKLNQSIVLAERSKKITANKSSLLRASLSEAKSENDLETVFRELSKYLK